MNKNKLLTQLQHNDRQVRYQALCEIELDFRETDQIDPDLIECLSTLLQNEDSDFRCKTIALLAQAREQDPADLVFNTLAEVLANDKDPAPRKTAVEYLHYFEETALPVLIAALDDPDDEVRSAAANSLSVFNSEYVFEPLVAAYHCEKELAVKTNILAVLASGRNENCLPLLVGALDDSVLRPAALQAISYNYSFNRLLETDEQQEMSITGFFKRLRNTLDQVQRQRKATVSRLFKRIAIILASDPEPELRVLAADCFTFCEQGLDLLISALKDPHADVREKDIYALGTIRNAKSVSPLLELYRHEQNQEVKQSLLSALGEMQDERVLPVLLVAAENENAITRLQAISSLGECRLVQAITPLCRALNDPLADIRQEAARSLGYAFTLWNIDVTEILKADVTSALYQALTDTDSEVRANCAEALGDIQAKSAIPALALLLQEDNETVNIAALKALGAMQEPHCLPYMLTALNNPDYTTQAAAAAGLKKFCDATALPELLAYLEKPDATAKNNIILVVAEIGDKSAAPVLIKYLQGNDEHLRESAAKGLGFIPTQDSVAALIKGLDDEDSSVCHECILSLARTGAEQAIAPLQKLLNDNRASVRRRVLLALASFENFDIHPLLDKAIDDDDEYVRETAFHIHEELENDGPHEFYNWGTTHYE